MADTVTPWRAAALGSLLAGVSTASLAQVESVTLDPVTVTAQRTRQTAFDAPASISAVTRDTIEAAGPQVNLSEAMARVPGISVLNRQNYAQDLQLSIRGFGARSTFGIRGVRLIVDGIPATMPDGQGQAATIALGSAGRIEVLRGPLAQLYGNAAGGVVQVFTQDDADKPTGWATASAGPYGERKLGVKFSTSGGGQGLTVEASQFRTDGYREHSDAVRGQLNARWQADLGTATHASVVLNVLEQPQSHDPQGLTRAQWEADPRQAAAIAIAQDARKSVRQQQLGGVVEHRLGSDTTLTARLYLGGRDLANALATPLAAQTSPTSSGGIVQFERLYGGGAAQLTHRIGLDADRSVQLTGGVEWDRMREDRQGYINNAGQQGALKRSELNTVENHDAFAQAAWDFARAWTLTAGARASRVQFRTQDRYIAPGNPDDSGGVDYSATNPVLGIAWRAAPSLNLYANAGRGFETPTFTELAYRPTGSGLNTDLRASRSRHAEAGLKWKAGDTQRIDVAVFDIATRDEIVVDTNNGGRTTFKNAGRTSRRGIEASYSAQLADAWRTTWSLTALRARFVDDFVSGSGTAAVPVAAGSRLPGTPERNLFGELVWTPARLWPGLQAAIEVVHVGSLVVDDVNDDAAPAATVVNLRASLAQDVGAWRFSELLRLDNAGDRRYAGSVIVNDANRRFFEPALPRHWMLSVTARLQFN